MGNFHFGRLPLHTCVLVWASAIMVIVQLAPTESTVLSTNQNWTATSGPVVVSVDRETFSYSVAMDGKTWLDDGRVAIQCGGARYCSECGNLTGGPVTIINGTDKTLGSFQGIQRVWTAGACTALTTSIRQYDTTIEFVSDVSSSGARGTVTEPGIKPVTAGNRPVTEFPSLTLPNVLPPPPPPPPPPPFPPPPPPGPPDKVGCSDGSCEGFCAHPMVRGCGASWTGAKNLRATPTGKACGQPPAGHACAVPADACGPGWGLCLSHAHPGLDTLSFLKQMDAETCGTDVGAFVSGMSHAPVGNDCPIPANQSLDNTCKPSSYGGEPLCCGAQCLVPSCNSALWPGKTRALIGAEFAGGCAAITIRPDHEPRGVLCCRLSTDVEPAGGDELLIERDMLKSARVAHSQRQLDISGPGLMTWTGNSLRGIYHNFAPPANFGEWKGGLEGGPVVLYAYGKTAGSATASLVLGPSKEFKVGILSRVGHRLVGGAQGMITELPPHYSLRFALVGRGDGVTSGMMAYGAMLRKAHGTAATKLSLTDDPLSRQLHYVSDGGSLLNYCDYWPQCVNSSKHQFADGPAGCTPMSFTLDKASNYHKSLGLNVSVYHVDPFWSSHSYSQTASQGLVATCSEGAMAKNMTACPWHFPDGLKALGIRMMLFLQGFSADNVYAGTYKWAGQSVAGADSARFFTDRFKDLTSSPSQMSALTLDGVGGVWYSDPSRYNNTEVQQQYDEGLSSAALDHKIPFRVDQELPSDILASVRYGARTVARCTYDANPCPGTGATGPWAPRPGPCTPDSRWTELAGAALLLAPVGLRPFTDVIWTTSVQSADPRWGVGAKRPTVVHDLIVATLSAGPVGFGDLVGHTDAALLSKAIRKDGNILKPAATALRIERFYLKPPIGGAEIWTAPTGPAGSAHSDSDSRANSMVLLSSDASAVHEDLWWWSILATNVNSASPSGAPVKISELWPAPPSSTQMLVATLQRTEPTGAVHLGSNGYGHLGTTPRGPYERTSLTCVNGSKAASCLSLWDSTSPLEVGTVGTAPKAGAKNFTLLAAAPVLSSRWALLGDLTKLVPCSPQRFVSESVLGVRHGTDRTSAGGGAVAVEAGLSFTVLGSPGERVPVTVVAPPTVESEDRNSPLAGTIIVVDVVVAASGETQVECAIASCTQNVR